MNGRRDGGIDRMNEQMNGSTNEHTNIISNHHLPLNITCELSN